ncbi:MAG TPA: hypothetical protein VFF48_01930 [Brevundimonas sp.]|nr:hypothetical protein [Brevundimonas sp.]
MISALAIGAALTAALLAAVQASRNQARPKPVPVRARRHPR